MFHLELLIFVATEPARFSWWGSYKVHAMIVRTQLSWYNIVQTLPFNCTNIVRTETSIVRTVVRTWYEHCMNKIEQMQDRVLVWFGLPTLITKPSGVVFTQNLKMYIWWFLCTFWKKWLRFPLFVFFTTVNKSLVTWNQLTPAGIFQLCFFRFLGRSQRWPLYWKTH